MNATLVRFRFGDDFDEKRVRALAESSRATFEDMPGLRSKAYAIDAVNREAVNFFLWSNEEAARSFFSPQVLGRFGELYGVAPTLEFAEVIQLVENRR
ncbi:hypothetical protein H8R02_17895 [Ramlibacter sp. GTP1]|uniref:ABM domain-containing protein n=2 Tax=Ramlibacter albus TaxID=2079448 RepID=A0A923MB98_9BURK|nr:hypothetical protein [Ramlibacter albus]